MSPVRMHFWQVAARLKLGSPWPMNSRLNWFIPAGVNRTVSSSGHEHVARLADAPLGDEEVEERFAKFVGGHVGLDLTWKWRLGATTVQDTGKRADLPGRPRGLDSGDGPVVLEWTRCLSRSFRAHVMKPTTHPEIEATRPTKRIPRACTKSF